MENGAPAIEGASRARRGAVLQPWALTPGRGRPSAAIRPVPFGALHGTAPLRWEAKPGFLPTRSPSESALRLFAVRSRRSQITDHHARYVVHKPPCFIAEDVRATQDCRVGQRFHYRH